MALFSAFALIAFAFNPALANAQERIIFDSGHVDAFNVYVSDAELKLNLKEDVTGLHVHRTPEEVELHVKSAALRDLPAGYPGAPKGFFLPQTQDHNLLWPGWDTLGTKSGNEEPSIKINFLSVEGPGTIHLFGNDPLFGAAPLLESGSTRLQAGEVRNQSFPAHTHANWVFSAPGVYTIKVNATGTIGKVAKTSNTATYTFTVGDEFRGAVNKTQPAKPNDAAGATEGDSVADNAGDTNADTGSAPEDANTDEAPADELPADEVLADSPGVDSSAPGSGDANDDASGDESGDESADAGAENADGTAGENAGDSTDVAANGAPSSDEKNANQQSFEEKKNLSANAKKESLKVEVSKPKADEMVCTPTKVTRPATEREIAAATAKPSSVSGSYTVPANTHTHPNWVFSKAGNYQVSIRQSVKLKNGTSLSADSTLNFTVGSDAGNANGGHFDYGAMIENGKLVPAIKDDRQSPAKWVNPATLNFALGNAAKAVAPAGIEFVAEAGSEVWMIPSAQVAGVTWLGANTMHESLIAQTTGEMTYTLLAVNGPGNMAVFTSGNFGQIVGAKWFSATAGSSSTVKVAENEASAKPGQIFKSGNGYQVLELKGQTATGDDCKLSTEQIIAAGGSVDYARQQSGQLPSTGANTAPALLALALIALGAAVLSRKPNATQ